MADFGEGNLNRINVSICAFRHEMRMGKHMIKALGDPDYIAWRINKARDSFIIIPCGAKEPLSFKVPEGLHGRNGRQFRITSKSFITEIFEKINLDVHKNYMIPGIYVAEKNCVVFNVSDAFENMLGTDEE